MSAIHRLTLHEAFDLLYHCSPCGGVQHMSVDQKRDMVHAIYRACERLVPRFYQDFPFLHRVDIKNDVIQDVLMSCVRLFLTRPIESPDAYLCTVIKNACLYHVRMMGKRSREVHLAQNQLPEIGIEPVTLSMRSISPFGRYLSGVARVDVPYRMVEWLIANYVSTFCSVRRQTTTIQSLRQMVLIYIEGQTIQEVVANLCPGMTVNSVQRRHSRTREAILQWLDDGVQMQSLGLNEVDVSLLRRLCEVTLRTRMASVS